MTEEDARARDVADANAGDARPVPHPDRARRHRPAIYLAGQSLGLQPRTAAAAIATELDAWARLGVDAWFDPEHAVVHARRLDLRESMGRIVGARPVEVALLNSLTVDIHLLFASFFRPDGRRRRILADGPLFPSDRHALTSHLAAARTRSRDGPRRHRPARRGGISSGPRTSRRPSPRTPTTSRSSSWPGSISRPARRSRSNGSPPPATPPARSSAGTSPTPRATSSSSLHDWDVDFAAWCTYKYLNGGPGSVGAIFVHERHARDRSIPRLGGWWGLDPDVAVRPGRAVRAGRGCGRLGDLDHLDPGARAGRRLAGHLRRGRHAGAARTLGRADRLTSKRSWRIVPIEIITPRDPAARGAQLLASPRRRRGAPRRPGRPRRRGRLPRPRPHPRRARSRSTRPTTRSADSRRSSRDVARSVRRSARVAAAGSSRCSGRWPLPGPRPGSGTRGGRSRSRRRSAICSTCSSGSPRPASAARRCPRRPWPAFHLARVVDAHLLLARQRERGPVLGVLHRPGAVGVEADLHLDHPVDQWPGRARPRCTPSYRAGMSVSV